MNGISPTEVALESLTKPDMAQMLTKREWFVGMAFHGILSGNPSLLENAQGFHINEQIISKSVELADALIAKLKEAQ